MKVLLLPFFFSLYLGGCATIEVHSGENSTPAPYSGTGLAVKNTGRSVFDYEYFGEVFVRAVDVPLCFIADTIIFPYDVYQNRKN